MGNRRPLIGLVTWTIVLTLGFTQALGPANRRKDWVGKEVLPRQRDFTLRSSDNGGDQKGRPGVYEIKQANGSSLLVEGPGISGWVTPISSCRSSGRRSSLMMSSGPIRVMRTAISCAHRFDPA